jgi:hypothetical protein
MDNELKLWMVWTYQAGEEGCCLVVDTEENVAAEAEEYELYPGQPRCACGKFADHDGVQCGQCDTERMEEDYRHEWDIDFPDGNWPEEQL